MPRWTSEMYSPAIELVTASVSIDRPVFESALERVLAEHQSAEQTTVLVRSLVELARQAVILGAASRRKLPSEQMALLAEIIREGDGDGMA